MPDRNYYVEGNTVRKLSAVPSPKRMPAEELNPKTKKKIERVLAFDLKYTLVLVLAVGVTFWACISMISVQAEINAQNKRIAALEADYQALINDNDAVNAKINSEVNLESIKKIAMEELGMIYPKEGQIITYDSKKEQYVKQYQDVPDLD